MGTWFLKSEFLPVREAGFEGQLCQNCLGSSLLCLTRGETKVTLPKGSPRLSWATMQQAGCDFSSWEPRGERVTRVLAAAFEDMLRYYLTTALWARLLTSLCLSLACCERGSFIQLSHREKRRRVFMWGGD